MVIVVHPPLFELITGVFERPEQLDVQASISESLGNPPEMLEENKSLSLKLHKLIVILGKNLRAEMGYPAALQSVSSNSKNECWPLVKG